MAKPNPVPAVLAGYRTVDLTEFLEDHFLQGRLDSGAAINDRDADSFFLFSPSPAG